tara:strand:- start:31 stop:846 length:816 start_codon:yes stop_codon:yes gene_type:complete
VLQEIRELDTRAKALRKSVRALTTTQVRRAVDRTAAKGIVDDYFRVLRDLLEIGGVSSDVLTDLDTQLHALLDASHKLSAVATYDKCLKQLSTSLRAAEKAALKPAAIVQSGPEPIDARIIATLAQIVPSAARAYEQAVRDLSGAERLSWRGPATDLREALRETLDHLAPDDDVKKAPGFKLEPDTRGPTMKQKVRHILSRRGVSKSLSKTAETSASAVDDLVGAFVRSVYTRSSISTHTPTDRGEVLRIHSYVRAALCELLEVHSAAQLS